MTGGGASPPTPPHLTGRGGHTSGEIDVPGAKAARPAPEVTLSDVGPGYATVLARGFDTLIETFDIAFPPGFDETMEVARASAQELNEREGQAKLIVFGGEEMQISPKRGQSYMWWLANDDFTIVIRSPKMAWSVTVRYSAAGLWEHGVSKLRGRAISAILREGNKRGNDWERVSGAHFAFDFYSPEFSQDMKPGLMGAVVCHSSVKKHVYGKWNMWGRADYIETLTVGNITSLQIQVYDKGKEITEASGKTWMVTLWEREGYYPPDGEALKDVWRLEIRMGAEFLKDRSLNRYDDMIEALQHLLCEALVSRRLTVPNDDSNRSRWPMHPLWTLAYKEAGEKKEMVPLGRQLTQSGKAIMEQLMRQAAGTLRAATVLRDGGFDEGSFGKLGEQLSGIVAHDENHERKVDALTERYRYVNEAR